MALISRSDFDLLMDRADEANRGTTGGVAGNGVINPLPHSFSFSRLTPCLLPSRRGPFSIGLLTSIGFSRCNAISFV
jgi:hypothetical protein